MCTERVEREICRWKEGDSDGNIQRCCLKFEEKGISYLSASQTSRSNRKSKLTLLLSEDYSWETVVTFEHLGIACRSFVPVALCSCRCSISTKLAVIKASFMKSPLSKRLILQYRTLNSPSKISCRTLRWSTRLPSWSCLRRTSSSKKTVRAAFGTCLISISRIICRRN